MDEQRATLAWLDDSLEWARSGNRTGSVDLLNLVRSEILFDMAFSERRNSARDRATASGPHPAANGRLLGPPRNLLEGGPVHPTTDFPGRDVPPVGRGLLPAGHARWARRRGPLAPGRVLAHAPLRLKSS